MDVDQQTVDRLAPPATPAVWSVPAERARQVFDQAAGWFLFLAALPVMATAWLVVRLTSTGPGVYTQTRVGLAGRHFRIYKLRSMYHNCEATMGGVKWSTKDDPRVTPVGRVLRKLHVDELPQLWNVAVGDMSLVGPRPERPELVAKLARQLPAYPERLAVSPGLTGLAQIQLPPDTSIDSVREKLRYDRAYIAARSPWLDLRVLVGTAFYLLGCSYALVRKLALLPDVATWTPAEASEESAGAGLDAATPLRPALGQVR